MLGASVATNDKFPRMTSAALFKDVMPTLQIDQQQVIVPEGASVLDAARMLGIDIPALCQRQGCKPNTSCLCCVVRVNGSKRLVPSCSTAAVQGMRVESQTPDVMGARRTALELLLSDHAGDCQAPCQNVCPAHMDIPQMMRQIQTGQMHEALLTVKEHIALPAILGRICPELCEKGCRRGLIDAPVSICQLKRTVADADLFSPDPWLPPCAPGIGKRVAIVGAGPAGLAAAWYLLQHGHACVVLDEHEQPGGNLRYAIDPQRLPRNVLDAEIQLVRRLGAEFHPSVKLGADVSLQELSQQYDAVLLALGELDARVAASLGLPVQGHRIQVDAQTMQTPLEKVFAAGAVVTPYRHAVRAVAAGRQAALSIDAFVRGSPLAPASRFAVRLGVLSPSELEIFKSNAVSQPRQAPDMSGHSAEVESIRCLSCDCAKTGHCALQRYAILYNAQPAHFRSTRREMTRNSEHPEIIYEPGKCIACGLCVQIAQNAVDPMGLAFVGRGFSVRVAAPLDAKFSQVLQKAAKQCADACPTGALSLRKPI
jgi:ferredoxin